MKNYHYPQAFKKILAFFKKLPGIGNKTAERFAFQILQWREEELVDWGNSLSKLKQHIFPCLECGALKELQPCPFCGDPNRDPHILCILSSPREIFLLEQTHSYKGLYHVLENLLSPLEGKDEASLGMEKLLQRIQKRNVREVILALEATLEGDATSLYIKESLKNYPISLSRLAMGIPLGSSLEYIDSGTLSRALIHRQSF